MYLLAVGPNRKAKLKRQMHRQQRAKTLDQLESGQSSVIKELIGGQHFISRATAIGFTPGAEVVSVQNYRSLPLIVFLRDTQIAIDRVEARRIVVDEPE